VIDIKEITCYNNQNGELYHYGVKGMKWGVRKEYEPVGRKKRSVSRSNKKSRHRLHLEEKYRSKGMSDNEAEKAASKRIRKEKIAIGAAAVVAAIATYKLADSGELNRLAQKGKAFIHGNPPQWRKKPSLADPTMSVEDIFNKVVKRINPEYFNPLKPISEDNQARLGYIGSINNCRRCTFAYELSRRGFDVKATKTLNGTGQDAVGVYNAIHENTISRLETVLRPNGSLSEKNGISIVNLKHSKNIFDSITTAIETQCPNRSRGELQLIFNEGGGHSIAWEIIDGKARLFDCQTRTIYDSLKTLTDNIPSQISDAGFLRLDDKKLNVDFLSKWVKNT
jgi:hypothetical protein